MLTFRFIILTIIYLSARIIFEQEAISSSQTYFEVEDSFKVEIRIPSDNILDKYRDNPDFNYNTNPEPEDWITKIRNWINQQLSNLQTSTAYLTAIDIVMYTLMVIAIIIIIVGLIKSDVKGLFYGNRKKQGIKVKEYEEDIHQLDFEKLIADALESKNYKLAIRYKYLNMLKVLADKKIINLNNNKTNRDYLREINTRELAESFKNATVRFEWIWYGNFPVNEELLTSSELVFNELLGKTGRE